MLAEFDKLEAEFAKEEVEEEPELPEVPTVSHPECGGAQVGMDGGGGGGGVRRWGWKEGVGVDGEGEGWGGAQVGMGGRGGVRRWGWKEGVGVGVDWGWDTQVGWTGGIVVKEPPYSKTATRTVCMGYPGAIHIRVVGGVQGSVTSTEVVGCGTDLLARCLPPRNEYCINVC